MAKFLESERLYLRGVEASDLTEEYVDWMNDPEINQYMETWFFPHPAGNILQYIEQHYDSRDEPFFAIIHKCFQGTEDELHQHIGNIKLGPINWIHRNADISLFIGKKDLWGQGFATEAINLLSGYAFRKLGLHKLKAGIYTPNVRSQMAFQKAGFAVEGELPRHLYFNGDWVNLIIMGRINE